MTARTADPKALPQHINTAPKTKGDDVPVVGSAIGGAIAGGVLGAIASPLATAYVGYNVSPEGYRPLGAAAGFVAGFFAPPVGVAAGAALGAGSEVIKAWVREKWGPDAGEDRRPQDSGPPLEGCAPPIHGRR